MYQSRVRLTAPVDEEEVAPALPATAGRGLGVLVEVHVGHGHAVAQLEQGEQRVGLWVAQQATRAVRLLRGWREEGGARKAGSSRRREERVWPQQYLVDMIYVHDE